MKNVRLVAAVALGSVSGALIGYSALAGGDKVAFPENFDKGTLYATVDRYDNKQYRELYATTPAVETFGTANGSIRRLAQTRKSTTRPI
jgi:hypothetical protein